MPKRNKRQIKPKQQLTFALAQKTPGEPPVQQIIGPDALPAPILVTSLQQGVKLINAPVVKAPIVVICHASSALMVLPPPVAVVLLLVIATVALLATGVLVVEHAKNVGQVLLQMLGPTHKSLPARAYPATTKRSLANVPLVVVSRTLRRRVLLNPDVSAPRTITGMWVMPVLVLPLALHALQTARIQALLPLRRDLLPKLIAGVTLATMAMPQTLWDALGVPTSADLLPRHQQAP
jgi:hypothetical protein